MGFCQLHIHTQVGSNLDGIGSSNEYAERANLKGHTALAITDHGKLAGFFEHQNACKKYGIKAIFGVELYIADKLITMNDKEKRERGTNYHITVLVKNETGYKNLLKLNYLSNKDEEHFYYVNRVTLDELIEHKEGLILLSGCMNSPINKRLRDGKVKEAEEVFKKLLDAFGENFYTEIQLIEPASKEDFEIIQDMNIRLLGFASKYSTEVVLTGDVHYLNNGDDFLQTISIAIRNKQKLDEMTFEIESKNLYYHDEEDYIFFNEEYGYNYKREKIIEWCNNTEKVASLCNYEMPERTKMHIPSLTIDDDETLINYSVEGLCKIFKVDNLKDVPVEYSKRLKKELDIIIRKGFSSYLLILKDVMDFVEDNKYFRGPGRGSAAASLVCYSLNITTLDPIKYNLVFERFLNESRTPDMVCNYFDEEVKVENI